MRDLDPIRVVESHMRRATAERARQPRFSDAYWLADDELRLLRVLHDEVARTGRIREALRTILRDEARALAASVDAGGTGESNVAGREPGPELEPGVRRTPGVAIAAPPHG